MNEGEALILTMLIVGGGTVLINIIVWSIL